MSSGTLNPSTPYDTAEINSGVYLLKSKIRQVPLFNSGGHGLGLGLKNLVLFTSLVLAFDQINYY